MYLINCFGIHLYTFSTSGHQTVLPAYIGVCGVAPWPVTLSTWVTTVVFCISQLRNYIYRESMLMGILNGIKRERSTNKLKPVVNHISSAAKFNIPIIPDISSISRLKTTACIKPFTLFWKETKSSPFKISFQRKLLDLCILTLYCFCCENSVSCVHIVWRSLSACQHAAFGLFGVRVLFEESDEKTS